jgi:hypothetical protein
VEEKTWKSSVRANAPAGKNLKTGYRDGSSSQTASPFRYFNFSPEMIWLVVMTYLCFLLSLRNVEDLLAERGIDICRETERHW